MILSNVAIQAALDEGRIVIVPPPEPRRAEPGGLCPFNTTSVDLRLGHEFVVPEANRPFAVDLSAGRFSDLVTAENYRRVDCRDGRPYELRPREFVLAQTMETVALPIVAGKPSLAARVEGRSSFARCGMLVHFTAPTIHAGYRGTITLEMTNLGPIPQGAPFEMNHLEPGSYVLRSIGLPAPVRFNIWAGQRTDLGKIPVLPSGEWRWRDYRKERTDAAPTSEPAD